MEFISYSDLRKTNNTTSARRKLGKDIHGGTDSASVAKSVLLFLSLGLTNGAKILAETYTPKSKAQEFVMVSGEIFGALRREYNNQFVNDSVVMCMKVNHQPKRIELNQYGRDVMLSLDKCATIINSVTLAELYANVRNDMIKHPEIYGKDRHLTAISSPAPT
ncbi:MAG: hypothetical protein K0R08_1199 [Solimicrobium sp.]|jgi:hypothetical protein|nr:hypothetical protein [Solimicrobium sp.]